MKSKTVVLWCLKKVSEVLPVFFWAFLIFGMDESSMATMTIVAALIHELGHIGYIYWIKKGIPGLRGVPSGFRIKSKIALSYSEEIGMYLFGPLVNIAAFAICSYGAFYLGESMWNFALINLATAVSNLLPIKGYDGYGIIRAIILKGEAREWALSGLSLISTGLIFLLCIFSLYLIDRYGGGYWIFFIFFISMLKHFKEKLQ